MNLPKKKKKTMVPVNIARGSLSSHRGHELEGVVTLCTDSVELQEK